MIGKPGMQCIGRIHVIAGHAHVDAQILRQARQEVAAADVGEIADADLRHAHARAL